MSKLKKSDAVELTTSPPMFYDRLLATVIISHLFRQVSSVYHLDIDHKLFLPLFLRQLHRQFLILSLFIAFIIALL